MVNEGRYQKARKGNVRVINYLVTKIISIREGAVSMTSLQTKIETDVAKYTELKAELLELERSLKKDLTTLDMNTFNGKSWNEHLNTINETIKLEGGITIIRESYRLIGKMPLTDTLDLTLNSTVYTSDVRYNPTLHYKNTDRYVSDTFPKKYSEQFEALRNAMKPYKIERPSDKYSRVARLSAF